MTIYKHKWNRMAIINGTITDHDEIQRIFRFLGNTVNDI
jgi:hypothetical protein